MSGAVPKSDTLVSIIPEQWLKSDLNPYSFWMGKITVMKPAVYQFNVTLIEGGDSIAIFGRYMDYPSVTKYDWVEYMNKKSLSRRSVSYSPTQRGPYSVSKYLSDGSWYVNVFNDEQTKLEFGLVVNERDGGRTNCINNCSGHGRCLEGSCECDHQWAGSDCSTSKFAVNSHRAGLCFPNQITSLLQASVQCCAADMGIMAGGNVIVSKAGRVKSAM